MRLLRLLLGTGCLLIGVTGLLLIALGPRAAIQAEATHLASGVAQSQGAQALMQWTRRSVGVGGESLGTIAGVVSPVPAGEGSSSVATADRLAPAALDGAADVSTPVTHLVIPRIGLDAPVVPAQLVHTAAGVTWEVPAYKVGHGQYTAGAGEAGNVVLLGHVRSLRAGNVFADLDRVQAGDELVLFGAAGAAGALSLATDGAAADGASERTAFRYRVTEVLVVGREDTTMVQPTETPTATLITCAGSWLPTVREYSHRLVVRAELRQAG